MSTSNGNGRGNSGVASIPASSKKMVQSLREIVNCPEHEIYAMLKECNMDPNDTVSRLLSQDPFHEVKSRREKKKEVKEVTEMKPRGGNASNRGGRGGSDHNAGRVGPALLTSTESGVLRGKPAYKKENGTNAFPGASGMAGNHMNRRSPLISDSITAENKSQSVGTGDGISASSQPSPGFQHAWLGVPGQVSMADIVKMGRPHGRTSSMPVGSAETSYLPHNSVAPNLPPESVKHPHISGPLPADSYPDLQSQDPVSKVSEVMHEPGIVGSQHVSDDEWPVSPSGSSILEPSAASEAYVEPSDLHVDMAHSHLNSQSDEMRASREDSNVEKLHAEHIGSASVPIRQVQEDSSGSASHFDDDSLKNMSSYQPHRHAFERQEAEDVRIAVSSAAASLQQLSLPKEELGVSPAEANPAVVIPNHLQVPTADCSHLSFGSFGSGISATFPGSFASKSSKSNLEEASIAGDVTSVGHTDTRNPDYYVDEQPRSTSDGNVAHRNDAGTENYDLPSSSQPEVMKQDIPDERHGHQYTLPSAVPGYMFENNQQPNAALSYAQANYQMQNLSPFSSATHAYTSSLPSHLLASSVQPVRESDLPYSPFLMTQSMPTKYSNVMSSISSPTISMPEVQAVKPGGFSTPQSLPGAGIATGPALPQHLTVHPYSQPSLPLAHFANMIGYPFLPQSYTYMPSAFQQAYAGNSTYHQSPATVNSAGMKYSLPQYKNNAPVSSLPQSGTIASGYGGFGSSAGIPGSFSLNQSSSPASTAISYEDVISSQYKDNNHFVPLQQNDSSSAWVHGPGSRTMSAVPASTYYSLQGQNQQHGGFRQAQQPSQHFGALGYPNFYHSQTGVSQEHQPQNLSDGTLSGSQGPPSKQSHQFWQHSY